jgi:hypothetical protein
MRVLLLTGLMTLLAAPEVSWADDSPAVQARVLSLDDRLPAHLRYEVKKLAQEFKKGACRVPWKTVGPVKHASVSGKNGRIPGWKVGKGKKAIFVGHKDRRCDFAVFRAPVRHGDTSAYNREINTLLSQRVKPVVKARNTAVTGVLTAIGGSVVGGLAIADETGTIAPKPVGVGIGTSMVLTGTLLTYFGGRAINKNAAIANLKRRKSRGNKQRKIAKSRAKNCFDKSLKKYIAQPSATVFALSSCQDLEAIMHPKIWDFGKVSDRHPAELAVRAANQIQA